jgi:tetratricopeptide (TPR) repeat protein
LEEAISYGERSAAIARELNLREQLAYVLNDIFPNYLSAGQLPKAFAALNEAEQLWRELDNLNLLADTLTNASELEFFTGRAGPALAKLNEAISLSEKTANPWGQSYERWMLGEVLLEQADYMGAIAAFEDSIRLGAQAGFAFSQIATRGHLALIYAELGAYEQGVAMARKSIEIAMTLRPEWRGLGYVALALCQFNNGQVDEVEPSLAMAHQFTTFYDMSSLVNEIVRAEIGLASGHYQAIAQSAAEAIKTIRVYGLVVYEPYALFYSGAALLKLGRLDEAVAQLAEAASLSRQLGTRRLLWRIQWTQATCDRQQGHHESADTLSAAAETEITSIANALPPNLRASFLARVAQEKRALGFAVGE